MTFVFSPNKGINNLVFGIGRQEVRNILGEQLLSKVFYRTRLSKNSTDSFSSLGIFVNYDENDNCEAFELYSVAEVIFIEMNLSNLSYNAFIDYMKFFDEDIIEDESGCTSFLLGIGAYAPNKDELPEEKIESIIVFKKGYYD